MSAETDAYSLLNGTPAVTAIVGTRIYPDNVPEEVGMPSIAIRRLPGTSYIATIHNDIPEASMVKIGFWCHAETRKDCEALADVVEQAVYGGQFRPIDPGRHPVSTPEDEAEHVYAAGFAAPGTCFLIAS